MAVNGRWDLNTNWETYNGTTWTTAGAFPTAADGKITIQAGDSIFLNAAIAIDQVVIENGGRLSIFNNTVATTVTLNDGPGTDIDNSGRLYVG